MMSRALRAILHLCAAAGLAASVPPAHAEITITQSDYAAGVLVVRGETSQPNQRVTLDGRYAEWTNRFKQFAFRVRYLPRDCAVQIRAGSEVRPAYVSNCQPTGASAPARSRNDASTGSPGKGLERRDASAGLRIVRQPCDRGGECRVICREGEFAISAYCPRGTAELVGERTVSCGPTAPSEIVAYCMTPDRPGSR